MTINWIATAENIAWWEMYWSINSAPLYMLINKKDTDSTFKPDEFRSAKTSMWAGTTKIRSYILQHILPPRFHNFSAWKSFIQEFLLFTSWGSFGSSRYWIYEAITEAKTVDFGKLTPFYNEDESTCLKCTNDFFPFWSWCKAWIS